MSQDKISSAKWLCTSGMFSTALTLLQVPKGAPILINKYQRLWFVQGTLIISSFGNLVEKFCVLEWFKWWKGAGSDPTIPPHIFLSSFTMCFFLSSSKVLRTKSIGLTGERNVHQN